MNVAQTLKNICDLRPSSLTFSIYVTAYALVCRE